MVSRIFRFFNGEAQRSNVDLAASIQPVYDYSRQAELGARGDQDSGYLLLGQTEAHVGVGNLFTSSDVYALFNAIGGLVDFNSLDRRSDRLWFVDAFCTVSDAADFNQSSLGIQFQNPDREWVVRQWNQVINLPLEFGGLLECVADPSGISFPMLPTQPVYLPPGTLMLGSSEADNAGTTTVRRHMLFWAGPAGTTPPGMQ